jgi:ribonuclease HII
MPTTDLEAELLERGAQYIIGLDEVGAGCLAGPVVAGAVALPLDTKCKWYADVDDSKRLSRSSRELLFPKITSMATAWAVAGVGPEEIDSINIFQARCKAMMAAFMECWTQLGSPEPVGVIVDGANLRPFLFFPRHLATFVNKADSLSLTVGAASIVAKVARDRYMMALDAFYRGYDWKHNVGYGTPKHLAGIAAHGLTPEHRRSFKPCR